MENLHKSIYEKLDFFHKNNQIPNIIFHGSSGTGKKTIVYNFLNKIYENNKNKIKHNVMIVNCSHGKGIKFIREELKFFAKTNIQSNYDVTFKSIVLMNADSLTTDAQSALRRCIELFSYNTRFFIIVENKHKLLNPILSRFCEIYVPEYINNEGKIENIHQYKLKQNFENIYLMNKKKEFMKGILQKIYCNGGISEFSSTSQRKSFDNQCKNMERLPHKELVEISVEIYDNGYSCLDLMEAYSEYNELLKGEEHSLNKFDDSMCKNIKMEDFYMKFHKIKSEFRCERLLILYMLDQIIYPNKL
jgi:hypothetical protein